MALTYTDSYGSAATLTGFVRTVLDQPTDAFSLARFLPDEGIDDIDFRAQVGGDALSRAAVFRAYDAESPITGVSQAQTVQGSLPPISLKTRVSEYDRIKWANRGNQQSLLEDKTETAGLELAKAIRTRLEVARGQALMDGKVTISENDLSLSVDFGRKAEHTQTASQLWGTAQATPLANLIAWRDIYSDTNGADPTSLVMSRKALTALLNSDDTRHQVYGTSNDTRMVTVDDLNRLLNSHGLPSVTVYGAKYIADNGQAKEFIDSKKILFAGGVTDEVGKTFWGVTAEALEPKYEIDEALQPGIVVSSFIDNDPVALWVKASAVALPVLQAPNQTFAATVLA